jgi:hypothetical protein
MPTITDAEVGQEIATDGILGEMVMVTGPSGYDDSYFTMADSEQIFYNVQLSTFHFGPGSVLLSNETIPFKSLVCKSMPKGCSFDLTFVDPPVLSSLSPDTAVSGDPDFVLSCTGTGFTPRTVIRFGSQDEPTTLVSETEVTTGVKPSLFAPAVVPVMVHNGPIRTDPIDFTFTEPVVKESPAI